MTPTLMLSELERQRLWEGLISAEVHAQYFAQLSNGYYRKQRFSTWGTLILSSGAFVAVVASLPEFWQWLRAVTTLAAAGLSFYSLVMQSQKMAADCSELFSRWSVLARQYRQLWENMYNEDAAEMLNRLDQGRTDLSKGATQFPNDQKTMARIQDRVEHEVQTALGQHG